MSLQPVTVLAAAADGEGENAAAAPLHRDELSLYTAPEQSHGRLAEPEAGGLEESVAALRKSAAPYTDWCRATYDQVKPKVLCGVQAGRDAYSFLKDPPAGFYPQAGVIAFSGVLGLFLAGRRTRVKRLLYPATLVAVCASLYYPEQAAHIAKAAGDGVYERAVQGYAAVERLFKAPAEAKEGKES